MTHATSFGAATGDYHRGRPGYPASAVAWLLLGAPERVLDVGAGTGKLTALAAQHAAHVIAVDPDQAMLAALTEAVPGVQTALGTAESLPLPDASVDAVVVGQAWHWFDVEAASSEMARVLRPGGSVGLIWNIRDSRVPRVARLGEAMRGSVAEQLIAQSGPSVAAPFGPLEHETWEWARPMSSDDVRAMARSRSHYIVGSVEYRAQVDHEVAAVLAELNDDDGEISLPYVTHAFRTSMP